MNTVTDKGATEAPQTVTIGRPDPATLARSEQLLVAAQTYVIDGEDMLEAAGQDLAAVRAAAKELEDRRLLITRPIDQAKAQVMALFEPAKKRLQQADNLLTNAIRNYRAKVEQERRLAEARAEEAARKEREKLERQAAQLEQKGKAEKAAALRDVAATVPTAVVLPEAGKMSALTTRGTWKAEITDKVELIKYIAANPQWAYLLEPDMAKLNGLARTQKENLALPGVKAKEVENFAANTRARSR